MIEEKKVTERLYYQDAFRTAFSAVVQEVKEEKNGWKIRLDRTAFYPEGGGQPADAGSLALADGHTVKVTDVQEEDGEVWHTVSEMVEPGTPVTGRLDFERRFDHMQQHSGEHIVSGMICSRFHCNNVGFHLGEDLVTIDFDVRIRFEQILEIEAEANRYIWEDHAFEAQWPSEEERKTMEYRSKKELEGAVRITSFPGADCCACCGTHVKSSAQVGLVKFLSAKNFHEGTRVELLCGKRALEFLAMNYRENKAVAVKLSAKEENTSQYVEKLMDENLRIKGEKDAMQEALLKKWAAGFQMGEKIFVIEDWMDPLTGRKLADLAADVCSMAAVFSAGKEGYNYAVISRGGDISGFIKEMNQQLKGRGGGRNGFAQGSVTADRSRIEAFLKAQGFRLA